MKTAKHTLALMAGLLAMVLAVFAAEVTLEWDFNDPSEEVIAYRIYEVVGTNHVLQATVPGVTNRATLTEVSPGAHTYVATASNMWAESTWSNPATTPGNPTAPTKVTVTVVITVQ